MLKIRSGHFETYTRVTSLSGLTDPEEWIRKTAFDPPAIELKKGWLLDPVIWKKLRQGVRREFAKEPLISIITFEDLGANSQMKEGDQNRV